MAPLILSPEPVSTSSTAKLIKSHFNLIVTLTVDEQMMLTV